jgi:hypothetical protein
MSKLGGVSPTYWQHVTTMDSTSDSQMARIPEPKLPLPVNLELCYQLHASYIHLKPFSYHNPLHSGYQPTQHTYYSGVELSEVTYTSDQFTLVFL